MKIEPDGKDFDSNRNILIYILKENVKLKLEFIWPLT